ncbi:MAG TPA: sulfotransferase [Spongiibacteraceae bacterium]|nr:sulfotransferase [Spongiibacteraceae bacterium]
MSDRKPADPLFDRPVFIVSMPRSGSTLLFETLLQARALYTIGGESHALIEGVPELNVAAHNFDSNRLLAKHATPAVTQNLRQRFLSQLRDRNGLRPSVAPVRMLEKTPKNSLRIPFLARVFPQARFVCLLRDPCEVLSSMLEAWRSSRFRTYPNLPGWPPAQPWSLLLTPGWRELAHKPLGDIVATQWDTAMRIMLDDLAALPASRQIALGYDAFTADWGAEITRLCRFLDLDWDRPLNGPLPLSRYTVSKPDPDKWRVNAADIEPQLERLRPTIERAAAIATR